ncbi:MAG: chemotaxis protein MotA [Ignavibacteriae bacterium]|jgi:chemotaxis protein MotA|nr:chemotaxis protein MotA [Ignavibacteriota bacterium]NOG97171.1 chemotaxis protein MotA [Ignavibacteriota bacterium]
MKRYGAINGLILGVISIFGAFLIEGGSISALFLIAPIIIVFGGTFSAAIIGCGFDKFKNIITLIKIAYDSKEYNLREMINSYVEFSIISRRDGLLSVEKHLARMENYFPQKIIKNAIDGNDEEDLRNLAHIEMKAMQDRHYSNIFLFSKMGGYAPTMGILGTVMALIMTLANAGQDPNVLINNIATAFIATLWGVFSANIFWLPIADKLKQCHMDEKHMMEMSLEGTIALVNGEVPSVLKARLISMLPQKEQLELMKM